MMDALEVGRVNVAARGVGIAQRALELALRYSQERKTFGKPIAEHQAIQFKLADMATKIEAARLLTLKAARMKDAGERSDLEAGMAKLFASETGKEVVEESFRIHGGYGYSKEYEIERLYRDAPLLLIGEGTSEIQRMVIGKKLLAAEQDLGTLCPRPIPSSLIAQAVQRLHAELPALRQLQLVIKLELRAHGARRPDLARRGARPQGRPRPRRRLAHRRLGGAAALQRAGGRGHARGLGAGLRARRASR